MFCEETFRDVDNRCLGCGASLTYKETNVQSVKLHIFLFVFGRDFTTAPFHTSSAS